MRHLKKIPGGVAPSLCKQGQLPYSSNRKETRQGCASALPSHLLRNSYAGFIAVLPSQHSPYCCNSSGIWRARKNAATVKKRPQVRKPKEQNYRSVLTEEQHVQRKLTCQCHLTQLFFVQESLLERTARMMRKRAQRDVLHIVLPFLIGDGPAILIV